jgi:hypothetical protein
MALDRNCPSIAPSSVAEVAVGCRQCDVQRWDMQTRALLKSYLGHSKEVNVPNFVHPQCHPSIGCSDYDSDCNDDVN